MYQVYNVSSRFYPKPDSTTEVQWALYQCHQTYVVGNNFETPTQPIQYQILLDDNLGKGQGRWCWYGLGLGLHGHPRATLTRQEYLQGIQEKGSIRAPRIP